MIDINTLSDFSRTYCGAICTFLVPANLLATAATLYSVYIGRSTRQIFPLVSLALLFAVTMFLHIGTWLAIGVIMAPTYILFGLGLTCFVINLKVLTDTAGCERLLQSGMTAATRLLHWGGKSDRGEERC
jgi:hypothetical protein